ncbi:hypothetical protein GGR92_004619 [Spirosoma lacussanchae]|uniref:hypothetical protein n=1 Tax=Spirosoma lacussanchae TaxID=1884249 RepID=UPI001109C872|nr:hypothetical protein [Spirosoma lacussanchae]
MSVLERYRFGLGRLLVGLYLAVLTNGVVFRHAHRLADGTIICHAHPYKSSPGTQFPTHTHSRDELIWLDAFANALYTDAAPVAWLALLLTVFFLTGPSVPRPTARPESVHVAFRHRGPPCI